MNAFIMSLDNITPSKYGINGHIEFTWSNHIKEQILQLNFQMVRVKGIQLSALYDKFKNILYELKNNYDNESRLFDISKSLTNMIQLDHWMQNIE